MILSLSKLIIGFSIFMLVVISLGGNLLVCISIYTDSRLRRKENLFLVSLAVSDLLVATLVMTFAGINELLGFWVFGQRLCYVWIATDIMCSTASILNLCTISLDRYLHIKYPFKYADLVTKRVVISSIVTIWALSAIISMFSLKFHRSFVLQPSPDDSNSFVCDLDLSPPYAVISSCISFCLPCVIMVSIYCRLYIYSRRQCRSISELCPCHNPYKGYKQHKAAITIGVVMGIFLICWVPFFSANILAAFCDNCVSDETFQVFTWLGYSNSMFNPFIYTTLNTEFRDSFKRILTRRLSEQNSLPSSHS